MKVDFYSLGSEVYFINDNQKVALGYITGIDYSATSIPNSDGYSCPIRESLYYIIDDKYRRKGEFVFNSKEELIDSL